MDKCEKDLFKAQANMPENVDYAERIASLKKAIAALKDPDLSNRETNSYLRDIVEKIKYIAPPVGSRETNTKLKVKLRL
jgi:hypothetical protein